MPSALCLPRVFKHIPKTQEYSLLTAAVSQARYKAEQQYSIWLRHVEKVLFVIPKVKNFPQLLRKIDIAGLRSASSYRTQNCLFLPQAWRPGLFALTTQPKSFAQRFCVRHADLLLLFLQGASCSGAQPSPWWCLRGCLLPSGPRCPCWAGGSMTMSPSEPAAPWTTAKGTGEDEPNCHGRLQQSPAITYPLWCWDKICTAQGCLLYTGMAKASFLHRKSWHWDFCHSLAH